MTIDIARVSIGLRGSVGAATIARIAPIVEELGFQSLWVSDSVEGDAIAALDAAASVTARLTLATGVIPLDRRPAATLTAALAALPAQRTVLGVGAGAPAGALARVRDGVAELRDATEALIVVGALGPLMRRLAATDADGVLLNWLTPEAATAAVDDLERDRGPRTVRSSLYVRTIVDAAARGALAAEVERKLGRSAYAANRERTGVDPFAATIDGRTALAAKAAPFANAVDELVLRVITADSRESTIVDAIRRIASDFEATAG